MSVKLGVALAFVGLEETAAGRGQDWWDKLSPTAKRTYLKENPGSKYGNGGRTRAAAPVKIATAPRSVATKQNHWTTAENQIKTTESVPALRELHSWYSGMADSFESEGKTGTANRHRKLAAMAAEKLKGTSPAKPAPAAKPAAKAAPASDKPSFPKEQRSAVKMRNHMVKHYGVKAVKNYSSNPYSSSQSTSGILEPSKAELMAKDLIAQGWKREGRGKNFDLKHADGGHISFSNAGAGKKTWINVFGDKKAKPTTLPYYD